MTIEQAREGAIETAVYFARLLPSGVAYLCVKPGVEVTVASINEVQREIESLGARFPIATLCDITAPHERNAEAVRYGASDKFAVTTKKLALLVGNPVARMAGNIFLKVKKPSYETRLFTDFDVAEAWLLEE